MTVRRRVTLTALTALTGLGTAAGVVSAYGATAATSPAPCTVATCSIGLPTVTSTDFPSSGSVLTAGQIGRVKVKTSAGATVYWTINGSEVSGSPVAVADATGIAYVILPPGATTFGTNTLSVWSGKQSGSTWKSSAAVSYQFYLPGCPGNCGSNASVSASAATGSRDVTITAGMAFANASVYPKSWDFDYGDGQTTIGGSQTTVQHTYAADGTYTVWFTAHGSDSSVLNAYATITVTGSGTVPPTTPPTTPPTPPPTTPPPTTAGGHPVVTRIAGASRYDTGVRVSQTQWQAGAAKAVVLATALNFPDALSGVPLAAHVHGPLLLTDSASLTASTAAEISRVLGSDTTKTVYILGGANVVSPSVEAAIGRLGYHVQRFGGADRYATSLQVAQSFGTTPHVVVATGKNFADALSAGPLAAAEGSPIVLSQDGQLDGASASFISGHTAVETVGGQARTAVDSLHLNRGVVAVGTFAGGDRYETSRDVAAGVVHLMASAQSAGTGHAVAGVGIASGVNFPDALTGGAYAANAGQPLLLVDPLSLPGVIGDYLQADAATFTAVSVFGGPTAVSQPVMTTIASRMGGTVAF